MNQLSKDRLGDFSVIVAAAAVALIGCAALYIALIFAQRHIPTFQWNMNDAFDLPADQKRCDVCKKAFYGSFFLTGTIAAFGALYFGLIAARSHQALLALFSVLLTYYAIHIASDFANLRWSFLVLISAAVPLGISCLLPRRWTPASTAASNSFALSWTDLIFVCLITVILFPSNLELVTAGPLNEAHKVSYLIGPALYSDIPGLVPGFDFHSHYGPALGWFFHPIMGSGWKSAATRAVGLNIALTWAACLQAYFLTLYLINSRFASAFVVLAIALLMFSTNSFFYSPSAFPTRFPLLFVIAVSMGLYCRQPGFSIWFFASALWCALSLLWQTEIGIYFLIAGIVVCAVADGFPNFVRAAAYVIVSLLFAAALSFVMFGPRALTVQFAVECVKPLFLYGTGWGSMPIKWAPTWNLIYNLPLQIVGVVTVGWGCYTLSRNELEPRSRLVVGILLSLSLIGIALLLKWVNRTLDAVWHQNALPLVIVALWWAWQFARGWRPVTRRLVAGVTVAATVASLFFVQDVGNPSLYALRSYVLYPSLINSALGVVGRKEIKWQDDFSAITPTETDFIKEHTKPDERVLIVAFVDWAYLAEANRAPKAYFLPLLVSFEEPFVDLSFDGAEQLFLDQKTKAYLDFPRVPGILSRIERDYEPVETRGNLTLYRKKPGAATVQPGSAPRSARDGSASSGGAQGGL